MEARMTSPPEVVTVRCPSCGTTFQDWYRASVSAELDPELVAEDEYVRAGGTTTCPRCEMSFEITPVLIVRREDTDAADAADAEGAKGRGPTSAE
jgi:hypothetical protein